MRLHRGGRCVRWKSLVVAGLVGLILSGCKAFTTASLRPLPFRERFGNPWAAQANARREAQPQAARHVSLKMAQGKEFGRQILADGDIVLRLGRSCRIHFLDVSRVLAGAGDSPFSHVGLVCREGDRVWVYDIESPGVRKIPFESWRVDVYQEVFAVKRLRPEFRDRIPEILAYCDALYHAKVRFDYSFKLNDDAYYCTEMISKAFASAGLYLSEPVPLRCLPNYPRYRCLATVLQVVTRIRVTEPAYVPGNSSYGLYASPLLETVYESPEATNPKRSRQCPPRCATANGGCPSATHLISE